MPKPSTDAEIVTTLSETFAEGVAIEAVSSPSSSRLSLLFRDARRKTIAPRVEYAGRIYQPLVLDETVQRATRFARDAKNYGSPRTLFHRIREVLEIYAGFTEHEASFITAWVVRSWFPDCISSPPPLLILGPDMGHAISVLRLLHGLCRRALLLSDVNRGSLLSLASLAPTLLVNGPDLSPRVRDLWIRSNYRGVHVVGNGKACSLATPKAIFLGMTDSRDGEGIRFSLRPAPANLPPLTDLELAAIADELQPQLLMFRLRNFEQVRNPPPSTVSSPSPRRDASYALERSVLGDAEIVQSMTPLLERSERESITRRGCDPHVAMVEVMWTPSHREREMTISRLTELTNALLRSRGELLEY